MSSQSEPSFRQQTYVPGDEAGINRAFNQVFHENRQLDEWQWKFLTQSMESRMHLVKDSVTGEVLAQYAATSTPFEVDGQEVQGFQPVDVFCVKRSDLAHSNAFIKLMAGFREEAEASPKRNFGYGFPSTRPARLYRHHGETEVLLDVPELSRSVTPPLCRLTRWRVVPMTSSDALDSLYARSRHRYPRAAVRDGQRLENRYLSRPRQTYHSVAAVVRGEVHAWAVFRKQEEQWVWVDLLWDGRNPKAIAALDRWSRTQAAAEGCSKARMWLRGDPQVENLLIQLGWEKGPNALPIFMAGQRYSPELPRNLFSTLYITRGDSDII